MPDSTALRWFPNNSQRDVLFALPCGSGFETKGSGLNCLLAVGHDSGLTRMCNVIIQQSVLLVPVRQHVGMFNMAFDDWFGMYYVLESFVRSMFFGQNEFSLVECGFIRILLPPPPKVKEVMFSPISVCLFVCVQDMSKSCERIRMKFWGKAN